jgi:hypothetical protein
MYAPGYAPGYAPDYARECMYMYVSAGIKYVLVWIHRYMYVMYVYACI